MTAPYGEEIGLTYDWDGPNDDHKHSPKPGCFLKTSSGRHYLVLTSRRVNSKVHQRRYKIQGLVIRPEEVKAADCVHELRWYSRDKAKGEPA